MRRSRMMSLRKVRVACISFTPRLNIDSATVKQVGQTNTVAKICA